ncbi:hypothetical protein J7E96_30240 [Streptomyces sp. ISL-96]|uniref:hypothetical protein n=1 Tax=Streptomyces sp. ISL-96 TaxID=2819191 RepID=UPI001BEBA34B|nr:hypothetical protein [Streptomyces sp. ISL-96]MBT2492716.1 hypothetical protein [Streptomyces sp. ISL-96]
MTALIVLGEVLGESVASAALRGYGTAPTAIAGIALVVLSIAARSGLDPSSTWIITGAGFASVMLPRSSSVGPLDAIATPAPPAPATGPTLLVLAGLAALGLLPASLSSRGRPTA